MRCNLEEERKKDRELVTLGVCLQNAGFHCHVNVTQTLKFGDRFLSLSCFLQQGALSHDRGLGQRKSIIVI